MHTDRTTGGLMAAATTSNKKVNQDAYALARNGKVPLAGLIVADGLGSHYGAEVASSTVATTLRGALEQIECSCEIDLPRLFDEAQQGLNRQVREHADELPDDLDWRNAFGTTVISLVETKDQLVMGYLGNGGIFHIRGNFNTFPSSQLLPWTAVNYLNPHSVPQGGKNVLYKLLSVRSSASEIAPTVLALGKDLEGFGDILLLCTDGIYSYDQTPMGRDSNEQIWISGEATLALFFESLKSFFAGHEYTEPALHAALDDYLGQLSVKNLVADDCTVGVLITERALRYQESLWSSRLKETLR